MKIGTKLWMVAGVCVLAVGCTGSEQPPPPAAVTVTSPPSVTSTAPPKPDASSLAWLNSYCGAVHGYRLANNERLQNAPAEQVVTKGSASKELGEMAELAGKTVDELTALPPSPFKDGDKAKQFFVERFTASRDAAAEGKRKVDAAKGNAWMDPGSAALTAAQDVLKDAHDPLAQFDSNDPVFGVTAAVAEKCRPSS
ncbi:hypothetical protein DMH04_36995 [Kibdelosporangium aridum]|uniref:Lipoprotein n=1 Tax=Kibdelosporangium aridum TaxID=2030 RepID=A0A428YZ24_KIBAR|nr:hypothetical protein [Kibdelosporangium aridum]RSM75911.1 hypothetical protein DMH04_36995 [Kibdelosporangium aridum]